MARRRQKSSIIMRDILSIFILLLCMTSGVSAQNMPERGEVRRGNKAYVKEEYAEAEEHYRRAVEASPESFEACYNLGSALVKGEKLEEAEKLLVALAADSLLADGDRSQAYYNLGNSQFAQQKLQEALENYKNAMRFDPNDVEAKYNYAYTKALLEQQDQDQDQDQQDQENQDQNQDQQDQNQDQENQDNQDQNQDQDQGDEQEQEQPQQPEPQQSEISEQEQQQMLDAIQAQEDKTQEDLKERARGVVVPGAKNW